MRIQVLRRMYRDAVEVYILIGGRVIRDVSRVKGYAVRNGLTDWVSLE